MHVALTLRRSPGASRLLPFGLLQQRLVAAAEILELALEVLGLVAAINVVPHHHNKIESDDFVIGVHFSGNVVLRSRFAPAKLGEALEEGILRALGLEVTVLVRTAAQLGSIVEGNPFLPGADPAKLHVTFLGSAPDAGRARRLSAGAFGPDELEVADQTVFLHCPNGYGRTKINNTFFEKKLGLAATTRNWKTVQTLLQLASAT